MDQQQLHGSTNVVVSPLGVLSKRPLNDSPSLAPLDTVIARTTYAGAVKEPVDWHSTPTGLPVVALRRAPDVELVATPQVRDTASADHGLGPTHGRSAPSQPRYAEPINILTGGAGRGDPNLAVVDVAVSLEHADPSAWLSGVQYS